MRTPATGSDTPAEGAVAGTVETALGAAWRDHWGRLTALLVAQFRRLDLAEDGLADAFEAAARTWPRDGVPTNPPAWLLTSARRRILDRLRAEAVAARKLPMLAVEADLQEEAQRVMADAGEPVRDERLRLVMLCAHPALSRENAAALTLRLVLGLTTPDIARLFLVSTPTMAARLTRARKSLADEQFEVPTGAGAGTSRRAGGGRRVPGVHGRLRAAVRAGAWCGPSSPARGSGSPGCCATCCPAGSTSTGCWR